MTLAPDARIDLDRFWSTIQRSAEIGPGRPGGMCRLALTDADKEVRDQFVAWCEEAGLAITIDKVGSIFARRAGKRDDLPPIVIGSHLDTQINGGKYDGIAGVLGGLEVVRTLNDLGHVTERPIEVVNWTNEEGGRFSPPMVASGCFSGAYELDWVHARPADDGPTFGEELKRIGYMGDTPVGGRAFDAYFELHIEQGPILHAEKLEVGIVTRGFPSYGMLTEFKGETAHTGPWPMQLRQNALIAGARFLTGIDDIGWQYAMGGGKATGSRLVAWPNKPGILSDWAQTVTDVRHPDDETALMMAEAMRRTMRASAAKAGCEAEILDEWFWGGDIFDETLVASLRDHARRMDFNWRDIQSQAGHDAYFIARHCPTAMIFTPCEGGYTHNNKEHCEVGDFRAGLNVLLHGVVGRADRA